MFELTPELNAKFLKFRESYEFALVWLADAPGNAADKERSALDTARRSVNASDIETEMFRKIIQDEIPKPD